MRKEKTHDTRSGNRKIKKDWSRQPRWKGVEAAYSAEDVYRLRGSVPIEHTLARRGAEKLWQLARRRSPS